MNKFSPFLIFFICMNMSHAGLFSSKKEAPTLRTTQYEANNIKVYYPSETDVAAELRLIKRSDTAKVVGLQTISFILGGSSAGFSKEDLKGNEIVDIQDKSIVQNPMPLILENIKAYIDLQAESRPLLKEKKYISLIYLQPSIPRWSLIYDGSDKNVEKGYSLNFGTRMTRDISESIVKNKRETDTASVYCNYKSTPLSLSDWQANDYANVAKYKSLAIEQCSQKFLQEIDQFLVAAESE